jgi:hypothetical protein
MLAISQRETIKFWHQRGRLLSALVRPALWLVVFAAGFQNIFGVSIIPPYDTYIEYQVYVAPGLLGMVLLFNGMQSSLAMVYDREMGLMRLLLIAPVGRVGVTAVSVCAPVGKFRGDDEFRDFSDVFSFHRAVSVMEIAGIGGGYCVYAGKTESVYPCGGNDPVFPLRSV